MQFVMHPDMVYDFPIWAVAAVVVGGAVLGAMAIELAVRRLLLLDSRRAQNDVAAAMFSVIGVLYAVLLAFIVMLVWEDFNAAKASSFREAAAIAEVWNIASGVPDPAGAALRDGAHAYARAVVAYEWPAQARGQRIDAAAAPLETLHRATMTVHPATPAEINMHAALIAAIARLEDARSDRLLAAQTTVPSIVWAVMVLGAAISIAFASFLRAPSLGMHLAMSGALALSGALVLVLVIALSNPFRGDFRVSTDPYDRVIKRIEARAGE
ncbi:MAG TPA: DUF4239 domain-containing protein [Acidisphaera sp.]|nr:DUF4239 domain-containing protein [Acidisphaera sp.]